MTERGDTTPPPLDRFGFIIDPSVNYARGLILTNTLDDARRMAWAWIRTGARAGTHGRDAFSILTGNAGDFLISADDIGLCNEWIAPGVVGERLRQAALKHLGGNDGHGFALFSRTSAVIICWLMLFGKNQTVLSVVPSGGHGHSSIQFGAEAATSRIVEVAATDVDEAFIAKHKPSCAIITSVTSSLEELSETDIIRAAALLRSQNCYTLLDDAYGARVRPILRHQALSLETGVDIAVTNGDKVGLGGPRAALVGGRQEIVERMAVWAAESGVDARGPIMVGTLRALESFSPEGLRRDAADGIALGHELTNLLGSSYVQEGLLGPKITEEDALELVLERGNSSNPCEVRPCEVTAALGLHLLDHGIITVNSHGQPGARVSLRLKPTAGSVAKAGGLKAISHALDDALAWVSKSLNNPEALRERIMGPTDARNRTSAF